MLESLRVGRNLGQGQDSSCLNTLHPCPQCLRPEDVAEAVIYVLSTPPHVQVSVALRSCLPTGKSLAVPSRGAAGSP